MSHTLLPAAVAGVSDTLFPLPPFLLPLGPLPDFAFCCDLWPFLGLQLLSLSSVGTSLIQGVSSCCCGDDWSVRSVGGGVSSLVISVWSVGSEGERWGGEVTATASCCCWSASGGEGKPAVVAASTVWRGGEEGMVIDVLVVIGWWSLGLVNSRSWR